uniref:Uncharacterized protein n=1 Tax=Anguilla anguilla TaxID=7936 RepID=A0A0E9SRY1_ANGAN
MSTVYIRVYSLNKVAQLSRYQHPECFCCINSKTSCITVTARSKNDRTHNMCGTESPQNKR